MTTKGFDGVRFLPRALWIGFAISLAGVAFSATLSEVARPLSQRKALRTFRSSPTDALDEQGYISPAFTDGNTVGGSFPRDTVGRACVRSSTLRTGCEVAGHNQGLEREAPASDPSDKGKIAGQSISAQ